MSTLYYYSCLIAVILSTSIHSSYGHEHHHAKILIQPFEVMDSFHSHFMDSLTLFLTNYYDVTLMAEEKTAAGIRSYINVKYLTYQGPTAKLIVDDQSLSPITIVRKVKSKTEEVMRARYGSPAMLDTIKAGNYSLFIYNSMDYGSAAVCQYLDIPCIQVITSGTGSVHNPLSLELMNSVPYMLTEYSDLHSMGKRLVNTLFYLSDHYMRTLYFYPGMVNVVKEAGLLKAHEGGNFLSMAANIPDSTLIYTNNALDCCAKLPPSYSRVGGAFLSNTRLEPWYQALMDGAIDGVVVVAFGKAAHIVGDDSLKMMLETFSMLNQTVLWALGGKANVFNTIKDFPSNVHITKSLPQNALLAHPNTHLLITHGGHGSTTEAIYHGIPIVAIPFAMDQKTNAKSLADNLGMGVVIDSQTLTADQILSTITHTLRTDTYKSHAMMASHRFRQCEPYPERNILDAIHRSIHSAKYPGHSNRVKHWILLLSWDVLFVFIVTPFLLVISMQKLCSKAVLKSM